MNSFVRFALAQLKVDSGNIANNLKWHKAACSHAAQLEVDVVVFPELSLTGYELELLESLALSRSSSIIKELSNIAVSEGLTVIVGLPLRTKQSKPYISAAILHPNRSVDFYHKQYLHQGEEKYCAAGEKNCFFSVNRVKLALAVCADFTEEQHYNDAYKDNADVYLVSALIAKNGFFEDSKLLSNIAKKINTPVLLSNYVGKTGGLDTAGRCSVWDNNGSIVGEGSENKEGLTLCSYTNGQLCDFSYHPFERAQK
ncbi:carbon-nitrogen hydrolase family protein [Vibrio marisflavi]|uniref:Glutamine-dependent NAD(+) synthetase n=1 Tax=Vibrio marisflavi CECT 7928 TaxID=634439 RepID=A0ABN8E3C8_9VIBR|nr:carbon-nitrogen hydrolase family protein [Vibrio marisflavi]CAH0539701.1 Glutamine-dependent NAD(+) synthetase [Vibrio marisflavi CECT 7928]